MEILAYQLFIVVTLVAVRIADRNHFYPACVVWTVLTLVNLFWPPLVILQLVVIWGTAALIGPKGAKTAAGPPRPAARPAPVAGPPRAPKTGPFAASAGHKPAATAASAARVAPAASAAPGPATASVAAPRDPFSGSRAAAAVVMPKTAAAAGERKPAAAETHGPSAGVAAPEDERRWHTQPGDVVLPRLRPAPQATLRAVGPPLPPDPKARLADEIGARGVAELVHFTQAGNLSSILRHGLLSVADCSARGIAPRRNDAERLDGRLDAISLSVSFPNFRMFYRYRKQYPGHDWVLLLLDPALLVRKRCAFCRHNAADHRIRDLPPEALASTAAFASLFDRDPAPPDALLRDCDPTDPQAEVLVFDGIEPSSIRRVVFGTGNALGCYSDVVAGFRAGVDTSYFDSRRHFLSVRQVSPPAEPRPGLKGGPIGPAPRVHSGR